MGNSQWERDWNGLHNWESRAHRLHEVIGTQQYNVHRQVQQWSIMGNNLRNQFDFAKVPFDL